MDFFCHWAIRSFALGGRRLKLPERIQQLNEEAKFDDSMNETFRLMDDRYRGLSVPKEGRFTFTSEVLLHLELPESKRPKIYISSYSEMFFDISRI